MINEQKFEQTYAKLCEQNAEKMKIAKRENKEESANETLGITFCVILGFIAFGFIYGGMDAINPLIILIGVLVAILIFFIGKKLVSARSGREKLQQYRKDLNMQIFEAMLDSFDEKIIYNLDEGTSINVYKDADFERFECYTTYNSAQMYLNETTKVDMLYIYTWDETEDSEGNTTRTTRFSGTFAQINIPIRNDFKIYLRCDRNDAGIMKKLFNSEGKVTFENLRVQLDSSEFEKIFDVYTDNETLAFQILTSDTMQSLTEIYKKYNKEYGFRYEITIKNGKIYLRVKGANIYTREFIVSFEYNKKSIDKAYASLRCIYEISSKIIEILNQPI